MKKGGPGENEKGSAPRRDKFLKLMGARKGATRTIRRALYVQFNCTSSIYNCVMLEASFESFSFLKLIYLPVCYTRGFIRIIFPHTPCLSRLQRECFVHFYFSSRDILQIGKPHFREKFYISAVWFSNLNSDCVGSLGVFLGLKFFSY